MDSQFDTISVAIIAVSALLAGYIVGRFARFGQAHSEIQSRPLTAVERDEVVALLAERHDVRAIKRLRELTGAGLREAHEAVKRLKLELGDAPKLRG